MIALGGVGFWGPVCWDGGDMMRCGLCRAIGLSKQLGDESGLASACRPCRLDSGWSGWGGV